MVIQFLTFNYLHLAKTPTSEGGEMNVDVVPFQ